MFFNTLFGQWIDRILVRIVPRRLETHPFDYFLHIGISFIGCLVMWKVLSFLFPKTPVRLRKGVIIIFWGSVGIGKELIDFRFGWDDIASDVAGITAAMYLISRIDSSHAKKL